MQFDIPEGAHVQIIIGRPAAAAIGGTLPALLDAAAVERPASRSGRPLLKGGLVVMLLAAAFAGGHYYASRSSAPAAFTAGSLAQAAPALPRPAPAGEQHPFPDRPLPRRATSPAPSGQIPAEFQKQLQQPPTVIPPPGQAATSPGPGTGSAASPTEAVHGQEAHGAGLPNKNPFGLEN
jgi:hypothetical protein